MHNPDISCPVQEASDCKNGNEKVDFNATLGDTAGGKGEDGIAFSEVIAGITTVGRLHAALEERYSQEGWSTLVALWHEAAGIQQPSRKSIRPSADIPNRILESGVHSALQPEPATRSAES